MGKAKNVRLCNLGLGLGLALCSFLLLPALSQAAEIEAGPGLEFGPVVIGTSSPSQSTVFTNRGSEPIVVEGVSLAGLNAGEFSDSNDSCSAALLLAGASCEVSVTFSPLAKQERLAELQLQVEGDVAASVELSGQGVSKQLSLPAGLNFGPVTLGSDSEKSVIVSNQSEAVVTINKFELGGPNSGEFMIANNNCGGALGPSMSCEVSLRFSPGQSAEEQAELRVISDGTPSEATTELSGEGVAAELTFEPSSHDFGLVEANSEGSETNFELRNAGAAQIQLNSLGIFGSGANEFFIGESNCYGATLQPAQTCSIAVHFDPHNRGTYSAAIQARVQNGETFEAELSGEGGRPILTPSPDPAEFGEVAVGSSGTTRTITMSNTGQLPAGFFIVIVSGGDTESFHLVEENCSGRVIAAGESCTAQVRFTPTSAGARNAALSFIGDGEGVLQVALGGVGIAASATLTPASHNFGALAEDATSPAQSFNLTNNGAAELEVGSVALSGLDADQFRLSTDTCAETTLAPGASCSLGARFSPDELGAKSAVLRVRTSAGTRTAALGGEGIAAAKVSFQFPGSLRLPSKRGGALKLGSAKCRSTSHCLVEVRTKLIGRVKQGSRSRKRSLLAPEARLRLEPGASGAISVKIPQAAEQFSNRSSTRVLSHLQWSTAAERGKRKHSVPITG